MPNTSLTLDNIKEETRVSLGVSGVEVELEDVDILQCIKDTLRLYNRTRPFRVRRKLDAVSAQKKYRIDDLHPGLLGVVSIDAIRQQSVFGDPFDPFFNDRTGLTVTGDTYGEFDQKLHYIEQARRIGSNEPEWLAQWEQIETSPGVFESQYFIYYDAPIPVDVSYTVTIAYTPDANGQTGLQIIPEGDTDWFFDYVLARSKLILSRLRGKYKGIVGPENDTTEIDYDDLKEEGQTSETQLKEDIKKRRRPLLPVIE